MISSTRPTKLVSCDGRFVEYESSERSGAKSPASPAASIWYTRSTCERSRKRCSPGRAASPGTASVSSRTRSAIASDSDDLAAVRQRHETRGTIQRGAVVVAVPLGCRAAVHGHPHAQGAGVTPNRRVERTFASMAAAIATAGSSNTASIPSPVVLTTAPPARLHAVPQQLVVLCERMAHRITVLLPQTRRTLDVREPGMSVCGSRRRRPCGILAEVAPCVAWRRGDCDRRVLCPKSLSARSRVDATLERRLPVQNGTRREQRARENTTASRCVTDTLTFGFAAPLSRRDRLRARHHFRHKSARDAEGPVPLHRP